jgi:hypothetical protein
VKAVALKPSRLIAAILDEFVERIGVVGSERQRIGRGKLNRQLRVRALAFAIREVITNVIRDAIQLTDVRRVDDFGV